MNDFLKSLFNELAKEDKNYANVEGKWTFADIVDPEWVHDTFETKEDAIDAAKAIYYNGCHVGQLKKQTDVYVYDVTNVEQIKYQLH